MATLDEVLEFYTRGGNFETGAKHFGTVFPQIVLRFIPEKREQVKAFLKTLTDERVRYKKAPFDHPQLILPNGHAGDEFTTLGGNPLDAGLAKDEYLEIPAVGADGIKQPILPFASYLAP